MNKLTKLGGTIAIISALTGVPETLAKTQKGTQQLIETSGFGIRVLAGQSIDPSIKLPKSKYNSLTTKERLESLMQGPCGAYGNSLKQVDSTGKMIEPYTYGNNPPIFDIVSLEKTIAAEIDRNNQSRIKGEKVIPSIRVDGRMNQETVDAIYKVSYSCG